MAPRIPTHNPEEMPMQPMLDGMPADPQPLFDPNRRRAFGSVPRLVGVQLDSSGIELERDLPHIDTGYIKASLYSTDGPYMVNGLALNEREYAGILINKPTFTERIAARAVKAHATSTPIRQEEVALTAPLHALHKQLEVQGKFVDSLTAEQTKLNLMLKYARQPGYAHSREIDLRMLATEILVGSFANIVGVVGIQRRWSEEERVGANQLLAQKLFDGPQRERVGMWQSMLGVTEQYTGRKRVLFTQRLHVAESGIAELTKKLLKFHATHELDQNF